MTQDLLNVTESARDFLMKSGFLVARLDKAEQLPKLNQWRLTFNVGLGKVEHKTVVVDDSSGKVVAFE